MLPVINREGPVPIYKQIQDWMRQQIHDGAWPEHYQLKREDDLADSLGVNRGTLRNAVAALIEEGLLVRIHGRGTFVAARVVEQPLAESFTTFSEGLMNLNIPYVTRVLAAQVIAPTEPVASLLNIPQDTQVFYLERVRAVKEKPLIFLKNYVVHAQCPGIETKDFVNRRLFDVIETDFGVRIGWGRRTFEAHIADAEVAAALAINAGDPVMYAKQVTYAADDTTIELSDIWITGDNFRLSATVRRGSALNLMSGQPEFMQSELRV